MRAISLIGDRLEEERYIANNWCWLLFFFIPMLAVSITKRMLAKW